jgi:hemerythrin-like domain-containing protein
MKATQELITEHDAVLVALGILEKAAKEASTDSPGALDPLGRLLDFFRGFVDRCHHGKEEDVLFPELVRRGIAREHGPIGVMLEEHEIGRSHVRAMADALEKLKSGDRGAAGAIEEHAAEYAEMLKSHIFKENNVLFQMANQVIPDNLAEQISEKFEEIERDRVGQGKHEEYHAMLRELKERYQIR